MEFKSEQINSSELQVEVSYAYPEIKNLIEEEVKKQSKKINVDGFRKGKVPPHIIKQRFGDALEYEAAEKIANEKFWEVIKEKDLNPINQPVLSDLKFEPRSDLSFKVKFEIMPDIQVENYTNNEILVPEFKVTEEEIDKEIKYLLNSNRTFESTDFVGEDDNYIIGVEIERLDESGNSIPASKKENIEIDFTNERVQPDIKTNSRNKKIGDSFDFSFTDKRTIEKEDHSAEEVEEKYFYRALINKIQKIILPKLDEELIKKITKEKFNSEDQLRSNIKNDIQNYYDSQAEEFLSAKIISQIIKNNEFDPPRSLVNNVIEEYVQNEEKNSKKRGYEKFDKEHARTHFEKPALNEVKWYMLSEQIIKKENLHATDAEIEEEAQKESVKTNIELEKLLSFYKSPKQKEKFTNKKLWDFLTSNNKIKYVHPDQLPKNE